MKTSMQLKAKARNLSATSCIPPHIIQRNYFLERFLERLSLSNYRNSIVLKGGVLIASILGIEARSTMDLDATMRARALPSGDMSSNVLAIVDEILRTNQYAADIEYESVISDLRILTKWIAV